MPSTVQIRLVQMEVLPGRPSANTETILGRIAEAKRDGIDLIVFPEMAIPGYLLGDEWEHAAFLRECEACGEEVRAASTGITAMFGNVGLDWLKKNEDGRVRKYNALFTAEDGRFIGPCGSPYPFVSKTLMPNYREFDDSRHFYDSRKLASELGVALIDLISPLELKCGRVGAVLCEDSWDMDYGVSPLGILGGKGVDFIVNCSCSPFTFNKNNKRNRVFSAAAARLARPLVYVNNTGIQNNGKTVFTFDGGSCVYDGTGNMVAALPTFKEGCVDTALECGVAGSLLEKGISSGRRLSGTLRPTETQESSQGRAKPPAEPRFVQHAKTEGAIEVKEDDIATLFEAIRYGTERFIKACGVEHVVVGASGGIDSAVVASLYGQIVSPDKLILVNMPSRFNSKTTINLARELAANLGCGYVEIPIEDSVCLTRGQMANAEVQWPGGARRLVVSDFLMENIQARDRSARVLAAVAAAFGGVFTCNANKSEMTVGYTTLYGDLGGYLANIADLWKGEVYAMGRYLNEKVYGRAVIPEGCFTVVPSAELSEAQAVDEGKGDPLVYPYHDLLLRSWVEDWNRTTPEEILEWYLEGTLEQHLGYPGQIKALFPTPAQFISDLERWWNQYQGLGVAKRIQAPPVLAVKRRAFGFDHRESQMGARYTRRYEQLKKCALG